MFSLVSTRSPVVYRVCLTQRHRRCRSGSRLVVVQSTILLLIFNFMLILVLSGSGAVAQKQQQQENFQMEVSWRSKSYRYYLSYEDLYMVPPHGSAPGAEGDVAHGSAPGAEGDVEAEVDAEGGYADAMEESEGESETESIGGAGAGVARNVNGKSSTSSTSSPTKTRATVLSAAEARQHL